MHKQASRRLGLSLFHHLTASKDVSGGVGGREQGYVRSVQLMFVFLLFVFLQESHAVFFWDDVDVDVNMHGV